jgi:hypothetical protein
VSNVNPATMATIKHKVVHIHKNKTNKTQKTRNKTNMVEEDNIKELLGQKS